MSRPAIYDGICNAQRELDRTATHVEIWPSGLIEKRLRDSAALLTAMADSIAETKWADAEEEAILESKGKDVYGSLG